MLLLLMLWKKKKKNWSLRGLNPRPQQCWIQDAGAEISFRASKFANDALYH